MVGTASNTPVTLLSVAANTTGGGFNNGANPGSKVQRAVFTCLSGPDRDRSDHRDQWLNGRLDLRDCARDLRDRRIAGGLQERAL